MFKVGDIIRYKKYPRELFIVNEIKEQQEFILDDFIKGKRVPSWLKMITFNETQLFEVVSQNQYEVENLLGLL